MKLAVERGLRRANPLTSVPRPRAKRSIPKHWTPDEARSFLRSQEGDRLYPLWAFLLGSGVRIGELVWLRWSNVDLAAGHVRIVEFATTLGWDLVPSSGKSETAVRTIDLDAGLVGVLRRQQEAQRFEARSPGHEPSEFVFTKPHGGTYHPQQVSKVLADLAVNAGLPRLTAHGLRHTSATLMPVSPPASRRRSRPSGSATPTRSSSSACTATSRRRCSGTPPGRSATPCSATRGRQSALRTL